MEFFSRHGYAYPYHPYRLVVPAEHARYRHAVFTFPRCTCECYCDRTALAARAEEIEKYRMNRPELREYRDSSRKDLDDVFSVDKPGRRNRTTYKRWQIDELERAFAVNPYPTSVFKKALAVRLGLRDSRVQVWFQNRRAKFKRERRGTEPSSFSEHQILDSDYGTNQRHAEFPDTPSTCPPEDELDDVDEEDEEQPRDDPAQ